jgi:hypothetical protein
VIGSTFNGIVLGYLLINTCKKSNLTYVYVIAFTSLLQNVFAVVGPTLTNWMVFCNPAYFGSPFYNKRCPSISDKSDRTFYNNIKFFFVSALAISYCFYNITHWLFSFRYFEVAEMLGRKDKSDAAHLKARSITGKISIVAIVIYIAQAITVITESYCSIFTTSKDRVTLDDVMKYLYIIFIAIDCLLLFVALIWIR